MKSKTWPLEIDHPEELIPRKISGAAQVKGLTLAFAILPTLNLSMALSVSKKGLGDIAIRQKAQPSTFPTGERPQSEVSAKMSEFLAKVPDPVPSSTRGSWRGVWQASPEGAILWAMERKLSSYTTVTVATSSDPTWAWEFKVERKDTWFAPAKNLQGFSQDLAGCIQKVIDEALDKVAEACTTRDTTRRNAIDQGYAEAHPPKVVAPRPSRLAKVAELPGKSAKVQKSEALASADCACKLPGSPPLPREEAPPTVSWKKAAIIPTRGGIVAQPLPSTFAELNEVATKLGQEAEGVKVAHSPSVALQRAKKLMDFTRKVASSSLCQGPENASVMNALQKAEQAVRELESSTRYEAKSAQGRVAQKLALLAARLGRACASGQMILPVSEIKSPELRISQRKVSPPRTPRPAAKPLETQVDADKDALLMNAFKEGIAAALAGSGV